MSLRCHSECIKAIQNCVPKKKTEVVCRGKREREGGDMEGAIGRACSLGKRCVSEHANVRERERDCVLEL